MMPLFPRLGPLEQRSPASSVLLRHYDFLRRLRVRLLIRSLAPTLASSFAPLQRRQPQGMALFISPRASRPLWVGRTQDLPGSWGILPVPLPRSRTPVGPDWPHRF